MAKLRQQGASHKNQGVVQAVRCWTAWTANVRKTLVGWKGLYIKGTMVKKTVDLFMKSAGPQKTTRTERSSVANSVKHMGYVVFLCYEKLNKKIPPP